MLEDLLNEARNLHRFTSQKRALDLQLMLYVPYAPMQLRPLFLSRAATPTV